MQLILTPLILPTHGTQEARRYERSSSRLYVPAVLRFRMPNWPMRSAFSRSTPSRKQNPGHPGMPMGMADVATVLFKRFLKFDPADPGATATGSYCRPAMARCCSMRCCI